MNAVKNGPRLVSIAVIVALAGLSLNSLFAACTPAPAGLVGWWKAENNALDETGTNSGSLVGGVTYGAGEVGQAFVLQGTGQGVNIGSATNLQLQNFSIEAWIKRASPTIVSHDGYQSAGIFYCAFGGYGLGLFDDGRLFLSRLGIDAVISTLATTDTSGFHHVAVTKNGTNVVFYLDGVSQTAAPYDPGFLFNGPMAIGARGGDYLGCFLGSIDEVAVYNRMLSSSEIVAIYSAGTAGKCPVSLVPPVITTQPQSQTVTAGNSVVFNVGASGTSPLAYQWEKNGTNLSGATDSSLRLDAVTAADAGVYSVLVSNLAGIAISSNAVLTVNPAGNCAVVPAGLVSWWKGESNAVDQSGGNDGALVGGASYGPGEVGQAFVFQGTGQGVNVGNPTNLQLQNFSIEAWIKRASPTIVSHDAYQSAGVFNCAYGGYGLGLFDDGRLFLSRLGVDAVISTLATTDTTRFHHVAVTKNGTNVVFYLDGVSQTAAPYDPGFVFNGPMAIGARGGDYLGCFLGSIDEVAVYNRNLSAPEVQAIFNAGAAGKCNSIVPVVTLQPQAQSVTEGGSASFSVAASGTAPLSYQWAKNGTPLAGATDTSLVLTNVQLSDAGSYSAVVTNLYGTATSSNAVLTVLFPPASIALKDESAASGNYVIVPVNIVANGNENALGFSLRFDPTLLGYVSVSAGTGMSGAAVLLNTNGVAGGQLGLALALPSGTTIAAGTQEVAKITFLTAVTNAAVSTPVAFADVPVGRLLTDEQGQALAATYAGSTVSIAAAQWEGDVFPRPGGDGQVNISDWVLIGRYVAALDSPTNANEFQRADCAPRPHGDGVLTVIDWVQAGRYAVGLDPLTVLGGSGTNGPIAPGPGSMTRPLDGSSREVRVVNQSLDQGSSANVSVVINSQGDENALQFSLKFDPTALTYLGAALGNNMAGGSLNVNAKQAGAGLVGAVLGLPIGSSFKSGTNEVLQVSFRAIGGSKGSYPVALTDQVLTRQISDPTAVPVSATYTSGALTINEPPVLTITRAGSNILLSWPSPAAGYVLQQSTNSLATSDGWTTISPATATNNGILNVTLPLGRVNTFYRLLHP